MQSFELAEVPFYKMHGSGNDFILIERSYVPLSLDQLPSFVSRVCQHHVGIGADGVVFISPESNCSWAYRWDFYNKDGSRAEVCGNAACCVAWLAVKLKLAGPKHSFLSDIGEIVVEVSSSEDSVTVQLAQPTQLKTNLVCPVEGMFYTIHFVSTGIPHVVIEVKDVENVDVSSIGSIIRSHVLFAPAGTNVNFVQRIDDQNILIRSYERGVGETLSCATGAVAAGFIMHALSLSNKLVNVKTKSGSILRVSINEKSIGLTCPVSFIFYGTLSKSFITNHC